MTEATDLDALYVSELENHRDASMARITALEAENAELLENFTALNRALVGDTGLSAITEAGRIKAENAKMREALKPFKEALTPSGATKYPFMGEFKKAIHDRATLSQIDKPKGTE